MKKIIIIFLLLNTNFFSQTNIQEVVGSNTPKSPETAQLFKFIDIPVGLYTGVAKIDVPIEDFNFGDINLPIDLNYHASGFKSGEVAPSTGLGWKLNSGGAIVRRVHGSADDYESATSGLSPVGFLDFREDIGLNPSNVSASATETIWDNVGEENFLFFEDKLSGCYDTEPDEFYITIGGRTGQFMFDWEHEMPIVTSTFGFEITQYSRSSEGTINSFTVRDNQGFEYVFSAKEYAHSITPSTNAGPLSLCSGGDRSYVSSWYLTSVKDLKNTFYQVNLTYDSYTIDYEWTFIHERRYVDPTLTLFPELYSLCAGSNGASLPDFAPITPGGTTNNVGTRRTSLQGKRISKIESSDNKYKLEFIYNNDRTDLSGITSASNFKSLDKIKSYMNGTLIKTYELNYQYNGRLLLESFQEKGTNNEETPPYKFQYNANAVAPIGSYDVDYWGYTNNSNNNVLLPTYVFRDVLNDRFFYFEGADRNPDENGSKSSVLEKITYPTGGYTEFDYEMHDYSYFTNPKDSVENLEEYDSERKTEIATKEAPINGSGVYSSFKQFTLPTKTILKVYYSITAYSTFGGPSVMPKVKIKNTSNGNFVYTKQGFPGVFENGSITPTITTNVDYIELEAGTYELQALARYFGTAPHGDKATISITYDEFDLSSLKYKKDIGGVRIKSISNYNANRSLLSKKEFDYTHETNGDIKSSGVIHKEPTNVFHKNKFKYPTETTPSTTCSYYDLVGADKAITSQIGQGHVAYKKVTVKSYPNSNGKEINHFTTPLEYPDAIFMEYPFQSNSSNSYKCGNLLKKEVYNNSGNLVSITENKFEFVSNMVPSVKMVWSEFLGTPNYSSWMNSSTYASFSFYEKITFGHYSLKQGFSRLQKTITTTYNELGQEPITSVTELSYDAHHNLKSQKSWLETDGNGFFNNEDNTQTDYFYLYDGFGYASGQNTVKTFMENNNLVGSPYKAESYQTIAGTTTLIGGSKIEYKLNSGKLVPWKTYSVINGVFRPSNLVTAWSSRGIPKIIKSYRLGATSNSDVLDDNYLEFVWNQDLMTDQKVISDLGTQTTHYDYNGNDMLERITDPNGQITEYDYDGLLRLKEVRNGKAVGESNFRNWITYDYHYKLDATGAILPGANNEVVTTQHFLPTAGTTLPSQVTRNIMDDLGREVSLQKDNFLPDGTDAILTTNTYDLFGRLATKTELGKGTVTYQYEASPLSRMLSLTGPIGTNTTSFGHNTTSITVDGKTYPAGTLSRQEMIDADGSKTEIFTDFLGREIQAVKYVTVNGVLTPVKTQKVYDQYNQLVKVIPPTGSAYEYNYNNRGWLISKKIPTQTNPISYYYDKWGREVAMQDANGAILATQYDDLGREITKGELTSLTYVDQTNHIITLPSTGLSKVHGELVYKTNASGNPMDWVDHKTEANMSTLTQATPTYYTTEYTYDNIGRIEVIEEENHRGGVEISTSYYNNAGLIYRKEYQHNTSNTSFGTQVNLNWDYTFDNGLRPENVYLEAPGMTTPQLVTNVVYNNNLQLIQKNLNEVGAGDYWQSVDYTYDNAGRLIKINELEDVNNEDCLADNYCDIHLNLETEVIGGATEAVINEIKYLDETLGETSVTGITYPFTLTTSTTSTLINNIKAWLTTKGYAYDEVLITPELDLITITQSNAPVTSLEQDDATQEATISNCCGAPVTSDLFAEHIIYPGQGTTISALEWSTTCNGYSKYTYQYDELKRMTKASYYSKAQYTDNWQSPGATGDYGVTVSYDLLGNIETLKRNGKVNGNTVGIDNLVYHYNTSTGRLDQVVEAVGTNYTDHGQKGSTSFMYDDNGNVTIEQSRGITIDYNVFDLPQIITKTATGDKIENVFLANEERIQKIVTIGGNQKIRDYIGSFEYETKDGVTKLEAAYLPFGRLKFNDNLESKIEYSIKDHLGSVRVNFTDRDNDGIITKADVLQENHQYPFGLAMEEMGGGTIGASNDYMFNGKEFDEELELEWYNYGARFYDPALGRWHSVDPKADHPTQYDKSSYAYCWNNPVGMVDPDGQIPIATIIAGVLGEYLAQVIENRVDGMDWGNAFSPGNISWKKVVVAGAMSWIPGRAFKSVKRLFKNKKTRQYVLDVVEGAVEAVIGGIENFIKDYWTGEPINLTENMLDGLLGAVIGKALPSSKFFERQSKKAQKRVARTEEIMGRKSWKKASAKRKRRVLRRNAEASQEVATNNRMSQLLETPGNALSEYTTNAIQFTPVEVIDKKPEKDEETKKQNRRTTPEWRSSRGGGASSFNW